jgi:hypothetical protein
MAAGAASASAAAASPRVTRATGHAASVQPCLVGRWVSTAASDIDGSGLANMHLKILATGKSTLNLTGSTPFVAPTIDAQDSFVGTEHFKLRSAHSAGGWGFSIFPNGQGIMETITFAGTASTKSLSESFFDAANYRCAAGKLTTNFDLSEGNAWLHTFVAKWKRY